MSDTVPITEADILDHVVSPNVAGLSEPTARSILDLSFDDGAIERMKLLLDRNNKGELTQAEQEELEKYQRVGIFIDLMQAKARVSLSTS